MATDVLLEWELVQRGNIGYTRMPQLHHSDSTDSETTRGDYVIGLDFAGLAEIYLSTILDCIYESFSPQPHCIKTGC